MKDRLKLPLFPPLPNDGYLRAIGPKTVHAERTLHFLSPQEYRATKTAEKAMRKKLNQQYGTDVPKAKSPVKSRIIIQSLNFDQKR